MSRRFKFILAIALAVVLVAGVAIASHRNAPDTDEVTADVVYTHAKIKERFCDGVDGPYAEQKVEATGTSTGDPRLSGDFKIDIYLLVNLDNGVGIERGTFSVRKSSTGKLKARGKLEDSGTAEITQGVMFGRVFDDGTGPGEATRGDGEIIANFRTTFGEGITSQIGGTTSDGRLPAVIWSGQCKGPFDEFEVDLSTGGAAGPSSRPASTGVSGWSRFARP